MRLGARIAIAVLCASGLVWLMRDVGWWSAIAPALILHGVISEVKAFRG